MKRLFIVISAFAVSSFMAKAQQGMGVGNNNPQEMLDVTGAIKIGTDINNGAGAPAGGAGTIRYKAGQFQGWNGSAWVTMAGGADTDWTVSGNNQYSAVSGNVGIGVNVALQKLHIVGTTRISTLSGTGTRMVVADANGDISTQTITSGTVTGTGTTNYVSKWTSASALGNSLIFDNGTNVGIGVNLPGKLLDVQGASAVLRLAKTGTTLAGDELGALHFDAASGLSSVGASAIIGSVASVDHGALDKGAHLTFATKPNIANSGEAAVEHMRITSAGNVGIGTTLPTAKLVVNGSGAMWNHNELKFYDDAGTTVRGTIGQYASNSDMVMASNVNNAWLRIGANNSNIAFMPDNTYAGGSSPAVVISANKRMGIGTTVPIAPLHVESQTTAGNEASYGNFWYYAGGGYAGGACCGGNVAGVSIHASGRVMASEFDAFSDARIKNIIGISNNQEDLQTLLNIEITDYKMKDALKGDKPFKKVIAQQVETVYPQATSTITEVVPDIYQMASINNGVINLANDVKVGDKVKLIFEEGNEMVEVLSTSVASFTVNSERSGDVFVYGREVNDFHVVDYEAIAMLNVSATQELFRLIQQLQKENSQIKTELKGYASLQSDIERLKEALGIDAQSSINK